MTMNTTHDQSCHASCADAKYFGVQHGVECWCGADANNYGEISSALAYKKKRHSVRHWSSISTRVGSPHRAHDKIKKAQSPPPSLTIVTVVAEHVCLRSPLQQAKSGIERRNRPTESKRYNNLMYQTNDRARGARETMRALSQRMSPRARSVHANHSN